MFPHQDNNGEIDIEEMANIIDTLDCIEGVQAGAVRYDENGHPVDTQSPKARAEDLFLVFLLGSILFYSMIQFQAIDKNNDGSLTLEEFLNASSRMSEILKRQDALEQRKKLSCLLFMSPFIQKHNDFSKVKPLKCIALIKIKFSEWHDFSLYQIDINSHWCQHRGITNCSCGA